MRRGSRTDRPDTDFALQAKPSDFSDHVDQFDPHLTICPVAIAGRSYLHYGSIADADAIITVDDTGQAYSHRFYSNRK